MSLGHYITSVNQAYHLKIHAVRSNRNETFVNTCFPKEALMRFLVETDNFFIYIFKDVARRVLGCP